MKTVWPRLLKSQQTFGNTLDIICTSDTFIIDYINVIRPGLSDHYIIVAKLLIENPPSQDVIYNNHKDILIHRKADINKFRNYMSYACEKLSQMDNLQQKLLKYLYQKIPYK